MTEKVLERIAAELRRLAASEARGEMAALRRLLPGELPPLSFYRVMARAEVYESDVDAVRRWARVVQIMALQPKKLWDVELGKSLFAIGVGPQRLDMLLSSRRNTLYDLARRTARRFAIIDEAMPYCDLCELVLHEDGERADNVRIKIAQSFEIEREMERKRKRRSTNSDN